MSRLACVPHAIGEDGGAMCIQVVIGPYRVLFDCGLTDLSSLGVAPEPPSSPPVDIVLCSHAHPDHVRGLLSFHQAYPQVPIFASEVTARLLPLQWVGMAAGVPRDLCQALPWEQTIEVVKGLTVQLWPAGHLPGAACFLVTYRGPERSLSVFYTGDFFLSNSRLVEGLPLEQLRGLKPDVLLVEGTHGTTRHPHRRQQENQLAESIFHWLQQGQNILMPTPTLGIGQELVMLLRSHHHFTGQNLTVWVDPTVAAGCDRYLDLLAHFPASVQNFARHQSLFWDERILPRVRAILPAKPLKLDSPCVVIAHRAADFSQYCRHTEGPWRILLPENAATALATAALDQGESPPETHSLTLNWLQSLAPELESGRVQLDTYLLTTHSDGIGTTQLIHNLRPQHVVFCHGSRHYLADLAGLEELQSRYQLHLPTPGQRIELPLGETFLQPAAPEVVYDGEVTTLEDAVGLCFSEQITADPRWQRFMDTGLVQARWQGDTLLIQGVSQSDLVASAAASAPPRQACCQACTYLRNQRCWNTFSPLYGRHVAPEGYCPAFAAKPQSA